MKKYTSLCLVFILIIIVDIHAQSKSGANPLLKLNFLAGEWIGEGSGDNAGGSSGTSSFRFDLDSSIITRNNFAYYPAANGKPEISHKDFMVIYKIADSIKAIYFDNENHIINYSVVADSGKAIFTSDASPNAPQFRLTYMLTSNDKMEIVFDIAPPGKTFFTYLAGKLKRK